MFVVYLLNSDSLTDTYRLTVLCLTYLHYLHQSNVITFFERLLVKQYVFF